MDPRPHRASRLGRLLFEVPLALALALAALYAVLRERAGDGGLVLLTDHEVLVRLDHASGTFACDDRPGAHGFVPWFQEVQRLDRTTVRYVMLDGPADADLCAPPLIVRGRDGSSFSFQRVEIQVALDPARADVALVDHGGTRASVASLVDAWARPVLRAAFGRSTPREILLPTEKQAASEAAAAELGRVLARHGVRLLELSVSKPRFPDAYQKTIERRLVADQETDRLVRERAELEDGRERKVADARYGKERERDALGRELARALEAARGEADRGRRETDVAAADRLAAATLARDEALARAAVAEERHRAEATAYAAELAQLAREGELAVRAALVERLAAVRFEIAPERPVQADSAARRASLGGAQ